MSRHESPDAMTMSYHAEPDVEYWGSVGGMGESPTDRDSYFAWLATRTKKYNRGPNVPRSAVGSAAIAGVEQA